MLLLCLHQRKAAAVKKFLTGQPVPPETQGRAAALHELTELLTGDVDELKRVFNAAMEQNKK